MQPKVSIITVSFNSAKCIEEAIKSVMVQTYPHIEYIIIDGDSSDGSVEIFNKYQNRIDKLTIEKDNGIFDAMNKGVNLASGDIIYFLNSDDKFYDSKVVEKMVNAFERHKKADFIYGNLVAFDPNIGNSYIEKYPKRLSRWLFLKKTIGHPATFFRTSCFDKVGYYNQDYRIAADYEWYLRAIFTKGLKSVHINGNVSVFRLGGNSLVDRNLDEYFNERILIQKKYFNNLEILYTRLLFMTKIILGERCNKFLHDLNVNFFKCSIDGRQPQT